MPVTRQKSASQSRFTYLPLESNSTNSFRIVTLLSGQGKSTLSCSLSHEDWRHPSQSYEAVSYFWGSPLRTKPILVDGKALQITSNLESALRHFRDEENGKSRRLWVDAICINQADRQERGQQVRQMFHIYNRASRVNVWLGDGTAGSDKAMIFMNNTLAPCFVSVGFSCMNEDANLKSKFWEEWDAGKDVKCLKAIDHLITPKHAKTWSEIADLFCRPWWSRAWCVQELLSAQKVTVLCGMLSVPWPLLDVTIQMMLRNTEIENLYVKKKQAVFHDAVEDAHAFAYERSHRLLDGVQHSDFAMLLQITRYRDCQDPRDKVFSVLSLLSDGLQAAICPDYSQSVQTVYTRAVMSYIQHLHDLQILSSCCWRKQTGIPNLPSWVPDWATAYEMSYMGGFSAEETDYNYTASGKTKAIASFSDDLRTLTVSGLYIDTVIHNRLQDTNEEFEYWLEQGPNGDQPSCSWNIFKIASKLEKTKQAVITRKDDSSVLDALFCTLIIDRHPILGKRRQSLRLAKQHNKLWPQPVDDYLGLVQLWSQQRTLIYSTGGYIGLAPSSTLPGDKICVLYGCHAPIMLRPRGDGSHTLIGDAYIHALMDGEAVAPGADTKHKAEHFCIR